MRHASDDEADPRPRVEPAVNEAQLGRVRRDKYDGEGDAGAAATGVQFLQSGHSIT